MPNVKPLSEHKSGPKIITLKEEVVGDSLHINQVTTCKNKAARLRERHGGDWRYVSNGLWTCSDGREVRKCVGLMDEEGIPQYWMYEDGKEPISVDFKVHIYTAKPSPEAEARMIEKLSQKREEDYAKNPAKRLFVDSMLTHMDNGDTESAAEMVVSMMTGDVEKVAGLMRDAVLTCRKPTGREPQVLRDTCDGIHPPHMEKYIRRVKK